MNQFSENEIAFFKRLLFDFDMRIDGRNKMDIRKYEVEKNTINNCFSSVKLIYEKENKNNLNIVLNINSMSMTNR